MFHLIGWPVLESREDDHEIGLVQFLNAGYVVGSGLNLTLGVHAEDNRAFKPMMLGQNTGEGWEGFLGAVFMVACDEYEVLTLAGATLALVDKRSRSVQELERSGKAREQKEIYLAHERTLNTLDQPDKLRHGKNSIPTQNQTQS